jgi:asparagine synthase (glutamine-hydrolysing)
MCGIAGYFLKRPDRHPTRRIGIMLESIRHRGPDDEGACLILRHRKRSQSYKTSRTTSTLFADLPDVEDQREPIEHDLALIHARYSIIDLTDAAHQPFASGDGSLIGMFNGEIYNYLELREDLSARGVRFRTASDTEVLVEGYRVWGERLWDRMNGFWAVALYDFENDAIVLSRDRIGVAPLYYREMPEGFFFSSTIRSLIDIEPRTVRIDHDVLLGFAQTGIKDHDHTTCYEEIRSLPSSTTVVFSPGDYRLSTASSKRYWDLPITRMSAGDISFDEAVKQYRETFFSAVEVRLRADVKVAFELSGGLDSSSVVAAAATLRDHDISTYTAKVENADEERYARAILSQYPVDYHVLADLEGGFEDDHDVFARIMEEPYDNPNGYTHHKMLQRMKADGVSVVVTGAGGDEILAGYESSFWPKAYEELRGNGATLAADWYEFRRRYKTIHHGWRTIKHFLLDPPRYLKRMILNGRSSPRPMTPTRALSYSRKYGKLSFHEQALYHFKVALVPYYMRSSDHFTMGIPVEHRFPFLDHRLVTFCLQMPIQYLFKNGWSKYLLRRAMQPNLPGKILWRRKKMGFTFPYRVYFGHHRSRFEPLLHQLETIGFPLDEFGSYDQLLKTNPAKLWRLLSSAIWVKNLECSSIDNAHSIHR